MALSTSTRRGGLGAPTLLLLCLGVALANASVDAPANALASHAAGASAKVFVNPIIDRCGEEGQQCCDNDLCRGFSECDTKKNICTPTCGREGQPCCDSSTEYGLECNARLGCFAGNCETCGFDGAPCCPETSIYADDSQCYGEIAECSVENTCTNALTATGDCGFYGDPCCEGGSCAQGNVCADGTCTDCGSQGSPCCRGGVCDYAADCNDDICGPPICGRFGGPCCAADVPSPPCTSGACVDGECVHCGFDGEPCCPTGMPCLGSNPQCTAGDVCEGEGEYVPSYLAAT